jgi:hypothetical protein
MANSSDFRPPDPPEHQRQAAPTGSGRVAGTVRRVAGVLCLVFGLAGLGAAFYWGLVVGNLSNHVVAVLCAIGGTLVGVGLPWVLGWPPMRRG